jgi:hypothetical protein
MHSICVHLEAENLASNLMSLRGNRSYWTGMTRLKRLDGKRITGVLTSVGCDSSAMNEGAPFNLDYDNKIKKSLKIMDVGHLPRLAVSLNVAPFEMIHR